MSAIGPVTVNAYISRTMKSLLVTILFFAAVFATYDYFGAPVGEKLIFKHLNVKPAATAAVPATEPEPAMTADKPAAVAPQPTASTTPEPMKSAPAAPPVTKAEAPEAPKTEANGFSPPKFEPLEALTANWTKIPPTAFPRPVTLLKDTLFKLSVGGSTIKAGAKAIALSLQGSQLTLAPTETSTARAEVPMDDTDLKTSISEGYERWKIARVEALRRLHERKQAAAKSGGGLAAIPAAAGSVDPAGKPVAAVDGSFPLLVAHLKSGEVTELKAENIRSWSDAVPFNHEGKPAWSVKVNAEVNTIFGLQPVEIMAVVRDGHVIGWYYTGTGEPVP